ncbi:MAG TPA: YlbF family regulator [Verrucomicrobiae bacterium]|nr:YlbF family regulator [Verrucomicrobiae bacterium]
MSQQIIDQARILSEMISTSEELRNLRDAEAKLANDPLAQDLLAEYSAKQYKTRASQQEGQEVDAQAQAEFDAVEEQVKKNVTISTYRQAESSFTDLLDSINFLIMKAINGQGEDCEPKGGCSSCSGCGH